MPNSSVAGGRPVSPGPRLVYYTPELRTRNTPAAEMGPNLRTVRNTPFTTLRSTLAGLFSCTRAPREVGEALPLMERAPMRVPTALAGVENRGASNAAPECRACRDEHARLEAWVRAGHPSECRAEARNRLERFRMDPRAEALDLEGLNLRELPPDLPAAKVINAFGNPLRAFPPSLPPIASLWIDPDESVFPRTCVGDIHRQGDFSNVDHVQVGVPRPGRGAIPLHMAVAMWFPPGTRTQAAAAWLPLGAEPLAHRLGTFLQALIRAVAIAWPQGGRTEICAHVVAWLEALRTDPGLRELTSQWADRGQPRDDNALLLYVQMQRLARIHALDQGHQDGNVHRFVREASAILRLAHLERIAERRAGLDAATPHRQARHDAGSIVLALLVGLRDRLALPHTVPGGATPPSREAKFTTADLSRAERLVRQQERDGLEQALDAMPAWQRFLARKDPRGFAEATARLRAWSNDGTFERLRKAYHRDTFERGDAFERWELRREATRVVSAELQHEAYGPLTRRLLQAHGHASVADALKAPDRPPRR